jgi:hypothetical protein
MAIVNKRKAMAEESMRMKPVAHSYQGIPNFSTNHGLRRGSTREQGFWTMKTMADITSVGRLASQPGAFASESLASSASFSSALS